MDTELMKLRSNLAVAAAAAKSFLAAYDRVMVDTPPSKSKIRVDALLTAARLNRARVMERRQAKHSK